MSSIMTLYRSHFLLCSIAVVVIILFPPSFFGSYVCSSQQGAMIDKETHLQIPILDLPYTQVSVVQHVDRYQVCVVLCAQQPQCLASIFRYLDQVCVMIEAVSNPLPGSNANSNYYKINSKDTLLLSEKYSVMISSVKPPESWIVIQERVDGSMDFYKYWTDYEQGFGSVGGDYWAGLSKIHNLTQSGPKKVRFEMKKFGDSTVYAAEYSSFQVNADSDKYRVFISGYDSGVSNAGDSLTPIGQNTRNISNLYFSTRDQDNDPYSGHCATNREGAFWFAECGWANPNGPWKATRQQAGYKTIHWYTLDDDYSLAEFRIKIFA